MFYILLLYLYDINDTFPIRRTTKTAIRWESEAKRPSNLVPKLEAKENQAWFRKDTRGVSIDLGIFFFPLRLHRTVRATITEPSRKM